VTGRLNCRALKDQILGSAGAELHASDISASLD
jgi:hypothetical protein